MLRVTRYDLSPKALTLQYSQERRGLGVSRMLVDYRKVKKVRFDGHIFASKLEMELYQVLMLQGLNGALMDLRLQPRVSLSKAKITVIPDFVANVFGRDVYFEAKGFETPVWRIKMKLWKAYADHEIRVYKKKGNRLYLSQRIIPDSLKG